MISNRFGPGECTPMVTVDNRLFLTLSELDDLLEHTLLEVSQGWFGSLNVLLAAERENRPAILYKKRLRPRDFVICSKKIRRFRLLEDGKPFRGAVVTKSNWRRVQGDLPPGRSCSITIEADFGSWFGRFFR